MNASNEDVHDQRHAETDKADPELIYIYNFYSPNQWQHQKIKLNKINQNNVTVNTGWPVGLLPTTDTLAHNINRIKIMCRSSIKITNKNGDKTPLI